MKLGYAMMALGLVGMLITFVGLAGVVAFIALPEAWSAPALAFCAGIAGMVVNTVSAYLIDGAKRGAAGGAP